MALGLLLCVSWICFLLFDCSAGLPKDQGHRYKDDALNTGVFDWQASDNKLRVNAQWPSSVQSPNAQSSVAVQRLVNGRPRDWSRDDPAKELVFPLSASYPQHAPAQPQPGLVRTPYPSGNTGYSSNPAGRYSNTNYMSTGSSPSAAQQGSFPSRPTNVGAQPLYPSRLGSSSSGSYSGGDPNFRPLNYRQKTPVVGTQNVALNQRVLEPIRPQLSSYIVQSRNGYQRASYLQSNSRYIPHVLPRGV